MHFDMIVTDVEEGIPSCFVLSFWDFIYGCGVN